MVGPKIIYNNTDYGVISLIKTKYLHESIILCDMPGVFTVGSLIGGTQLDPPSTGNSFRKLEKIAKKFT